MLWGAGGGEGRASCWLPFALPPGRNALLSRSLHEARPLPGHCTKHGPLPVPGCATTSLLSPSEATPRRGAASAGGCLPVPPAPRAPRCREERPGAGLRSSEAAGGAARAAAAPPGPVPPLPGVPRSGTGGCPRSVTFGGRRAPPRPSGWVPRGAAPGRCWVRGGGRDPALSAPPGAGRAVRACLGGGSRRGMARGGWRELGCEGRLRELGLFGLGKKRRVKGDLVNM